ncbi:hypothetical protein DXX94_17055 [Thalassotalea euphylliae]|uniref:Uncharacterized protein n=1 Tax=Thalassotalea euphylliae TaxID=1655234 RepID=A0A3E0U6D2_9GAMM|nr:hypothetical protein DXX94_17055 [Thalassotalea euphylliae]
MLKPAKWLVFLYLVIYIYLSYLFAELYYLVFQRTSKPVNVKSLLSKNSLQKVIFFYFFT